ncbi:MAG: four helix bundle protein [Bacteroidales bacterium]|nr:four helix bundle protein [Bacteroidales bacterium]
MYRSFTEMPVWQKAHELAVRGTVYQKNCQSPEYYGLTSQLRRASNSVSGNIAEGLDRRTKKINQFFYIIARGSVFDTISHRH